jgi:hypothetical protein
LQGHIDIHPLQALSYIVGGLTAVGALYLGVITYRANRRDKAKELADKQKDAHIAHQATEIAAALKAWEQANFIESLQQQIVDLDNELKLVRQRQRRGMAVQFSGAVIFFSLLVGLFFYEKSFTQQLGSANTRAQSASDTAIKASQDSDQAVKQVNAAVHSSQHPTALGQKRDKSKKGASKAEPPQ